MKYINVIVLLSIIVACNKEDDGIVTVAEGHVFHSGTKKPLEGVTVYLYDGLPGSSKGSSRIDSTHTDASGFFHVELRAEEPVLDLYKENYDFEYAVGGAGIGIVPLNVGSNINLRFELDARAWFDPTFINKTSNSDDLLKFADYAIDSFTIIHGIETTIYSTHWGVDPFRPNKNYPGLAIGDKYHLYMLEITREGVKTTILDSVYIQSFTTWADTIFY